MARAGRRRTLAQMDKDAQALALFCQGKQYRQISVELGWKSASTAFDAVRRALADRQKNAFDGTGDFALAVARVQRAIAYHEQVIATPHYVVSNTGRLVTGPDGKPLLDSAPGQRSAAELRHLYAELNKLQGTYAPTKVRQEVVTDDVVQREIDQLAAEIAEAGKGTAVPKE